MRKTSRTFRLVCLLVLGLVTEGEAATITNLYVGGFFVAPPSNPDNALTIGGDFLFLAGDYLVLQ